MQGNRPETGGHSDPMEMAAALNINRDTIIKQTAFSRLNHNTYHGGTETRGHGGKQKEFRHECKPAEANLVH